MRGYASVSVSRDLFDAWDEYASRVAAEAADEAAAVGAVVLDEEPTFAIDGEFVRITYAVERP